jgi:Envelope integrity protein A
MMLVYSLPATQAIYRRFGGIGGSAYFVGGFGMTALTANNANNNTVLVPIRSGVGLRLGANVGYLEIHAPGDLEPLLIAAWRQRLRFRAMPWPARRGFPFLPLPPFELRTGASVTEHGTQPRAAPQKKHCVSLPLQTDPGQSFLLCGCGLRAGSVSYLNICATIGPPTSGLSSASSASALLPFVNLVAADIKREGLGVLRFLRRVIHGLFGPSVEGIRSIPLASASFT